MQTPEDVAAMVRLSALGWGARKIARELGVSRNTVRRYVRQGDWAPYKRPSRPSRLDGHRDWLRERFLKHGGNAEVVRQELFSERKVAVSLRTVERAVRAYRDELRAQAKATIRFETAPGRQLQVDFGQCHATIGGEQIKIHLCVLTLGYSRRQHVSVWPCERQAQWLQGIERAFIHYGGVPKELLVDNARALVNKHDPRTREVEFHPTFLAFCKHWGITPKACAPYRARTKGKDERSVGYVKRNAIAGREFTDWRHLEQHLESWLSDIADRRIHGTTGERPIDRFNASEREVLAPLEGRPLFLQRRTLRRRVQSDLCVEVDTNHYSVPLAHLGKHVVVDVTTSKIQILLEGETIATHNVLVGKNERRVDSQHLAGVVRGGGVANDVASAVPAEVASSELCRSLDVYEQAAGGAL